jgi:hypothetical protein
MAGEVVVAGGATDKRLGASGSWLVAKNTDTADAETGRDERAGGAVAGAADDEACWVAGEGAAGDGARCRGLGARLARAAARAGLRGIPDDVTCEALEPLVEPLEGVWARRGGAKLPLALASKGCEEASRSESKRLNRLNGSLNGSE